MSTRDLPRVSAAALVIAYGAATVVVLVEHDPRVTSYFAVSPALVAAGLLAGIGMSLVGAVMVVTTRGPQAPLALLVGTAWLAPVWAGWEAGPPLVRSLAVLGAPMIVPLLFHLVFAPLRGGAASASRRRAVVSAYAVMVVAVVGRALVYEPIRDPQCWVSCGEDANVFLVAPQPALASVLGGLATTLTILIALIAATFLLLRALQTGWRLSQFAPVSSAATLALLGEAGYAVMLLHNPFERFEQDVGAGLFVVRSAAIFVTAVAIGWEATERRAIRHRVASLAREIGEAPAPGELEATLKLSLRDDSLAVRYWLPRSKRFVGASGRPAAPLDPEDPRVAALVVRGRQRVAVVLYDAARVAGAKIEDEIGSASRLVIDNERLRAEQLAQLEELRESRARIVEATDSHRANLERDLHDGAQQRLLAATFELRLARADAGIAGDLDLAARLDAAIGVASETLGELRDFAHGVFPAVLEESGLTEAVWSLTDTASVPVEVEARIDIRPPIWAERAAYLVTRAAVTSAGRATAARLRIGLECDGATLLVEATGVGPVDRIHLTDRVGAVGGALEVRDGVVRAVIPCAS